MEMNTEGGSAAKAVSEDMGNPLCRQSKKQKQGASASSKVDMGTTLSRQSQIKGEARQEQETLDKRRASPMSRAEMICMVQYFQRKDYDCKKTHYSRPNTRKDNILNEVLEALHLKFGVTRSKDQLRKRWSDLKLRERDQLKSITRTIKKRQQRRKLMIKKQYTPTPKDQHHKDVSETSDECQPSSQSQHHHDEAKNATESSDKRPPSSQPHQNSPETVDDETEEVPHSSSQDTIVLTGIVAHACDNHTCYKIFCSLLINIADSEIPRSPASFETKDFPGDYKAGAYKAIKKCIAQLQLLKEAVLSLEENLHSVLQEI
ncbi:hypothetical protein XELAEV_18026583mg [Xenopus laevis]|uniref:Uncharacterized protein n=1 Tax=Xenopus laevis TaxID=8355 RepID=A0A974HJ60_XENLA|nr:hypothetical protein XELAEV_18026583mg [Xenopus laevis]